MSTSISASAKKRGRPKTTGTGQTIGVRLHNEDLAALDRFANDQPEPKPTRATALREAALAWLRERGYLPKA